jgi:NitT/TauT family transport system substrate-binding protein
MGQALARRKRRFWRVATAFILFGLLLLKQSVGGSAQPEARQDKGGGETAGKTIVFQMHWYPQSQFAGYMMAMEKGYFRQAGLGNLSIEWAVAGERPFQRLAEGKSDFCTGWLADAIVERDRGMRLVHLAQVVQQSCLMLVAWRRSGIETPQDFTGKRVGLWGGNFDVQATALFRKLGVRPSLVPQSTSIVPFLRGAVDVASAMHYNEYHKLIEAGVREDELRTFRFSDYGLLFPEDGIYCTERTRRERTEVCAAVVKACRQGWDYALANEAETLDVVMRNCRAANVRTNRNHQRWMLRSIREAIRFGPRQQTVAWGALSQDAYSEVARLLTEQALIGKTAPFQDFHQPPLTASGRTE